ncbi:MAG: zf-HC2 domain-containing protein [Gemmatimonadaceae bacterium]
MSKREDCEAAAEQLWPYLDGALPEADRERVIRHLETCVNCTSHLEFTKSFLEAVHEASASEGEFSVVRAHVLKALAAEGFAVPA